MVVVNLERVLVLWPESFSVDGRPFKHLCVDFFAVLIERTQNLDVVLEDCTDRLDIFNQLMILYVSLQQGVDDFQKFVVDHQFKTSVVGLDIFENHERDTGDFLSANFLKGLAHWLNDWKFSNTDEFLDSFFNERKHPNI